MTLTVRRKYYDPICAFVLSCVRPGGKNALSLWLYRWRVDASPKPKVAKLQHARTRAGRTEGCYVARIPYSIDVADATGNGGPMCLTIMELGDETL